MRTRLNILAVVMAVFFLAGCSIFKPCDCPKFGKAKAAKVHSVK